MCCAVTFLTWSRSSVKLYERTNNCTRILAFDRLGAKLYNDRTRAQKRQLKMYTRIQPNSPTSTTADRIQALTTPRIHNKQKFCHPTLLEGGLLELSLCRKASLTPHLWPYPAIIAIGGIAYERCCLRTQEVAPSARFVETPAFGLYYMPKAESRRFQIQEEK